VRVHSRDLPQSEVLTSLNGNLWGAATRLAPTFGVFPPVRNGIGATIGPKLGNYWFFGELVVSRDGSNGRFDPMFEGLSAPGPGGGWLKETDPTRRCSA